MPPSRGLPSQIPQFHIRSLIIALAGLCVAAAGWPPAASVDVAVAAAHPHAVARSHVGHVAPISTDPSSTPAPTHVSPRADTQGAAAAVLPALPAVSPGRGECGALPAAEQDGAADHHAAPCRGPPAPPAPGV